jgi:uncharacterized RDD family membrane protein YckC
MNLYYADGDRQVGPIGKAELQKLIKARKVNSQTMVWQPGMHAWQELGLYVRRKTQGDSQSVQPAAPNALIQQSVCSECGQAFAEDDMIRFEEAWVCATCKPIFVQKIKEGVSLTGAMDFAGFWLRFGAILIDGIIMWIVNMIISIPLGFIGATSFEQSAVMVVTQLFMILLQFVIPAVYDTWFVGKYAATPGKMACRIKVVTADAGQVSYARALGRHFAKWISGFVLGIGYFMAAFDDQKRSLHDRICDTRVIRA